MDYPGKVITKTQVTPTQTSASGNWTLDDQAAAIKNNNWPVALVPNPISKSLRFNSADSAYLNRTPASAGNRRTWTWSAWVKRSTTTDEYILGAGSSSTNYFGIAFSSSSLYVLNYSVSSFNCNVNTAAVFRDPSAWYHIVVVIDTTQATGTNRVKIYVNNVQQTLTFTTTPTQNLDLIFNSAIANYIGATQSSSITGHSNGYMTEVNFVDGQALTPSDFGLTNPQTGQWIPKKYTGTYGTNGFYLNFKDATSTTTLGYDYSGNANNWTTNNFSVTAGAGNDSLTDVPTPWVAYNTTGDVGGVIRGNYATLNPLDIRFGASSANTLANGNLQATAPATQGLSQSSIMFTSDKWYFEMTVASVSSAPSAQYIAYRDSSGNAAYYAADGSVGGVSGSAGASYTTNDVIGLAVDKDAGTIQFYKNGATQGGSRTLTNNVAGNSYLQVSNYNGSVVYANFGQRPFAYTPPAGFRSLCTTNLPATTIGFGLTNQGDDYFNAVLYTGDGTSGRQIDVGFAAELVWAKVRSAAGSNRVFDILRGAEKALLTNTTDAELTLTGELTAFNSTGWVVGNGGSLNVNGTTYVSWNWKAGGTGVSNTAGTITSTVSANTTSGFSVVTYTGNGSASTKVGHGLGVAPSMMIVKQRGSAGTNWAVYHASLPSAFGVAGTQVIYLNATTANTQDFNVWDSNNTEATRFSVGASTLSNANGGTYVAYCFAAVAGYSAFGSYTGNGSTDGPFVYCGFRPRFILTKMTNASGNYWIIHDTARDPYNVATQRLYPNVSDAEATATDYDILSNGFKLRTTAEPNGSGNTFIYAAFAESPFKFANAR